MYADLAATEAPQYIGTLIMTAEKDTFAGDDFFAFSFAGMAFGSDDFAPDAAKRPELEYILGEFEIEDQEIDAIFSSSDPVGEYAKALQDRGIETRTTSDSDYGYAIYPWVASRARTQPSPHPHP